MNLKAPLRLDQALPDGGTSGNVRGLQTTTYDLVSPLTGDWRASLSSALKAWPKRAANATRRCTRPRRETITTSVPKAHVGVDDDAVQRVIQLGKVSWLDA